MAEKIRICEGVEIGANKTSSDEILERAGLINFKPGEEDKIWDKYSIYELERKHITEKYFPMLIAEVEQGIKSKDELSWERIRIKIEERYIQKWNPRLIEDLERNFFRDNCPEKNKIVWAWVFLILTIIAESVVLIVQGVMAGGLNPVIFLFAFLLAVGGWLVGNFLGVLFWIKKLQKWGRFTREEGFSTIDYVQLFLGLAIIFFVAIVRAIFGGEPEEETLIFSISSIYIFTLTVLLGMLVAVAKGTVIYLQRKRTWCLLAQQEALKAYASKLHKEQMDKYREAFEGLLKSKELVGGVQ